MAGTDEILIKQEEAMMDNSKNTPPPKPKPSATPRFTYEARSAVEYDELFHTDPRPHFCSVPARRIRRRRQALRNPLVKRS